MNILFYGTGSIGRRHIGNIRTVLGSACNIICYKTSKYDNESNEYLKSRNVKIVDSEKEAYKLKPNVVFVTNPTFLHYKTIKTALNNNCHVFTEKPICLNLKELRQIERVHKEKKLILFLGYPMRYHSLLNKCKKMIDNEKIGKINLVNIYFNEFLPNLHPWRNYKKIYRNKKEFGGDVALEFSHEIDYMLWIFGLPKKIMGMVGKIGEFDGSSDDLFIGNYEMNDNFIITMQLSYLNRLRERKLNIMGELGAISIDFVNNTLEICKGSNINTIKINKYDSNNMFIDEINDFFRCIKNKLPAPIGITDGKNVLKLIDYTNESSALSKSVNWK